MKKSNFPSFFAFAALILGLLAGCLPLSDDRIAALAQDRYIALSEPTPERDRKSATEQRIANMDLAADQILHLSGRSIFFSDPAQAYGDEWMFINQVFIGLTRQDMNTHEFLPAMAKEWEISADGLTWTFSLRQEIPWVTYDNETGQVVEVRDEEGAIRYVAAQDFKAGILRVLDPLSESGNAFVLFSIQGARDFNFGIGNSEAVGVQALDENTLVIQLEQPLASLDAIAELPLFSAMPSWLTHIDEPLRYSYGPYVVKENLANDKIGLVRNHFWPDVQDLPQPLLDEIYFDMRAGQDALSAYRAGELEALQLYPEEVTSVMADSQLAADLRFTNGTCGFYLVFHNVDMSPLNTPTARQAIAAAIDKEQLIETVASGAGMPLFQYVPPFLRGSEEHSQKIGIPYDVESAQGKAEEIWLGNALLTLASSESSNHSKLASLIKENLEENLGLEVVVDLYPWQTWQDYMESVRDNYYSSGMYLFGYCLDYADAQCLWDRWLEEDFFADVANSSWFNQDFSDALLQANAVDQLPERIGLYQQAEEIIINQDTVIVPLFWRRDAWLVNPKLAAPEWLLYPQLENWAFLK